MHTKSLFLITILVFSVVLGACSSAPTSNNSVTNKTSNTNVARENSSDSLQTTKTPEAAMNNNAPTLAPVVVNYYEALKKRDETSARKFLSQSALKYWQNEMKSEKSVSLLAILEENESPVEERREVRNERIEGDSGVAEIKGGSLGVWTKIKFVRENGEWKFASPEESLVLEEIKPGANSAK